MKDNDPGNTGGQPKEPLAFCLDRISQAPTRREGMEAGQPDSLTGGDKADSLVKPKWAEITDQNRRERVEQRGKDPGDPEEGSCLAFSRGMNSAHLGETT